MQLILITTIILNAIHTFAIHCLPTVNKGGDLILTKTSQEDLLIISKPFCYSYTPTNQFTLLQSNLPTSISKGASILKASPNDILLVSSTPFFLLHLDNQCAFIQRYDSVHPSEVNHPFRLTLLTTGEAITAWIYQSVFYFAQYTLASKTFVVNTYSYSSSNSNIVLCEEIALSKLLCIYYANNSLMLGLYDLLTSMRIKEETSSLIDVTTMNLNGYLLKPTLTSNEVVYCVKTLTSYEVLCMNIKESNGSISIQKHFLIQDFFDWSNTQLRLHMWELPLSELLILSREGTRIKTQRGFTDLTMKGSVYTYDFEHYLKPSADLSKEIIFELQPKDNSLLVLYETKTDTMLNAVSISIGSLDDFLFIGLEPKGGQINIDYYIKHSFIIFHSLPASKGQFTDLNHNPIILSHMYNVSDIIFQYDPITNPENKVNEWIDITATCSTQNDTVDLAIFSHQKPIHFAYCYHTCLTCFAIGDDVDHNCLKCASDFYHLDTNMKQCYNNNTKPENSFWDTSLDYFNSCYGGCKTCHIRGDKSNHLCDSCKEPRYLQPKGDLNCVLLCPDTVRWYVDLDGNYLCTRGDECLNGGDYAYYNPETKECIRTCSMSNEVYYQFECYAQCPIGSFIDEERKECYDECPGRYVVDYANMRCINCALEGKYNYKGICIDSALRPSDTYVNDTEYDVVLDCFVIDTVTGGVKSLYGIEPECINQCPLYYNYLPIYSSCIKCYETCLTCIQSGSDDKHNCIQCKETHISHPYKKGLCVFKCPIYWYMNPLTNDYHCTDNCLKHNLYLNIMTNQCVMDCPIDKVIYNNQCVSNCPDNTMIIYNYKCFPQNSSMIEMEDDWHNIFNKDDIDNDGNDSLSDYYNNISDLSPSIVVNDNFTVQVIDPKNETAVQEAIDNGLSLIDLGECEAVLRKHYDIPYSESLIILKLDITEDKEALTPIVKYKVYDHKGNRLNLDLCDDSTIVIEYPIINNGSIDLDKGKEYNDKGIDVFSNKDAFFNDICYPYTTSQDKDIPVEDRRKDIYQNASFCQLGCVYEGVDFEIMRVSCQCNTSISNKNDDKDNGSGDDDVVTNELFGEAFELFDSSTIMVVTCYELVFQLENLVYNVGFWLFASFTFSILLTMMLFSCFGYVKLYAYLNQFPQVQVQSKPSYANDKPIDIKTPSAPPIKQKQKQGNYNNNTIIVTSPSYGTNVDYCISKDNSNKKCYYTRKSHLESNELLCTPTKKYHNGIDSVLSMHNNLCNNKTMILSNVNANTPIGSNKHLPIKSSLSKASTNINNPSPYESSIIGRVHSKTLTVSPLKLDYDKPSNKSKSIDHINHSSNSSRKNASADIDYDSLEIEEAMIRDHRHLCLIYWSSIKTDQMIISLFTNSSPFAPFLIRFDLFIFTMSLFFSMNALLFSNQQISSRYHSNEDLNLLYLIKNEFTKCLYASLITSLVTSVFTYLVSNYNIRKLIKEETNEEKYIEGLKKHLRSFKWKIYAFFTVSMIVVLFCWYYVTAFCIVYANNRISWIEGSLITFALSNMLGFVLLFISSVLRYMANKMKWWCLFKVSLYVKDFAT